jgi:hypothetical protein
MNIPNVISRTLSIMSPNSSTACPEYSITLGTYWHNTQAIMRTEKYQASRKNACKRSAKLAGKKSS